MRATSAPNTYIFSELLETPQVQALAGSDEFAPYLTLLQIFSYGTYASYVSTAGLPALNDAQRLKLRQLSLLTLARKDDTAAGDAGGPALDYASLQKALDLPSRQALEELVISAVYAGLLRAQLNPKDSVVQINSVAPLRDVAPTAIGGLLSSLQAWAGRCEATLQSLSSQMTQLRAEADRRAARAAARAEETRLMMESEQQGGQAPRRPSSLPAGAGAAGAVATPSSRHHHHMLPPSTDIPSRAGPNQGDDAGRGGSNDSTNTSNEMNSMLTVGGGSSSFLTPTPGGPGAGAGTPSTLQVKSAVKRGCGQMDRPEDAAMGEGGAVDLDDRDDPDGNKRASRRKLDE